MTITYYPSKEAINGPLIFLVSHDSKELIVAPITESPEHHILLNRVGKGELQIDNYFRAIVDIESAEWTFVCPPNYKNITDKTRRTSQFFKDGFVAISQALDELGFHVGITIPKRYRRAQMLKPE